MEKSKKQKKKPFWVEGQSYFVRTVTHHITGRLVSIDEHEIVLEDTAWIASDGRFMNALAEGKLDEVEPFPDGMVAVGRGALIDASPWKHALPREQK